MKTVSCSCSISMCVSDVMPSCQIAYLNSNFNNVMRSSSLPLHWQLPNYNIKSRRRQKCTKAKMQSIDVKVYAVMLLGVESYTQAHCPMPCE